MSREEYAHLEKIAKEFEAAERHGENIVDSAKDIGKVLKKLEKMLPNTDKKTGDEHMESLAQEKALVEKSRPIVKNFDKSCNGLDKTVKKIKDLFHLASDEQLIVPPFPRYYGPDEEFER